MRKTWFAGLLLGGFLVGLLLFGCGGDPLQKLLVKRVNYHVQLSNWTWKGGEKSGEVVLDFLIQNENNDTLQYITALVEEIDKDNNVIRQRRVPLNVSSIPPGQNGQISVVVTGVSEKVDEGWIAATREANPPRSAYSEMPEFKAFASQ